MQAKRGEVGEAGREKKIGRAVETQGRNTDFNQRADAGRGMPDWQGPVIKKEDNTDQKKEQDPERKRRQK